MDFWYDVPVMKIFVDESGDLGFSSRSSKWFVVTLLLTSHHRKIEKCVKKVHGGLRKKERNVRELHAYHERDATRKRILGLISNVEDVQILCVILNKTKVYTRLQDQKSVLYNYVTNILLDRMNSSGVLGGVQDIDICIDQKETNKFMNDHFVRYLRQATSTWKQNRVDIRLAHSQNEKCLQAIDFVSWAIFRKYERGDYDFYNIIQNKIVDENFLFR